MADTGAAAGATSAVMGFFDKAVEAIPHDGARSALSLSRGAVEGVVEQGSVHAATAQDMASRLRGVSLSAGGLPRSFLLGVRHTNLFLALPCAAACLTLHAGMVNRLHASNTVPSVEAGPDPMAPSFKDRCRGWFTGEGILTSRYVNKYHAVQMILHGCSAAVALYLSRFVLPPPVETAAADANSEGQFVSTVRSLTNTARAAVGANVKDYMPMVLQRLVNCAVHIDLANGLWLSGVSYALHTVVVMYGSNVAAPTAKKALRAAHVAATIFDFASGIHAVNASSLPPPCKLAGAASFAFAAIRVAAPSASHCASDPLRLALASVSVAKAVAVVCSVSYGADRGRLLLVKFACLLVLGASVRATSLPSVSAGEVLRHPFGLPSVLGTHLVLNAATLWTLAALPPGTMLPRVSLFPVAAGTASVAGTAAIIDTIALGAVVVYQLQTKTFTACTQRVVRVPIPEAAFTAPSPVANATPEQLSELEREYDFAATVKTEKNMSASYDYLSGTVGDLSTTQNALPAAA